MGSFRHPKVHDPITGLCGLERANDTNRQKRCRKRILAFLSLTAVWHPDKATKLRLIALAR